MAADDYEQVGDLVTLVRGTTYKGALVGKPGPALLGLGSIVPGGGFRADGFKTYGGDCPEKLMLRPGDLYVSLKGATKDGEMIGSVAQVPPQVAAGRITQDTVKLVLHPEFEGLRQYLYWLLRTPQYRAYCAGHATGSAVVALSRDDFLAFPVPKATAFRASIINLLEGIAHKVELNQRMNETLEAMAQAIFKDWFVDFGPTRRKQEGQTDPVAILGGLLPDPTKAVPIADLFPSTFGGNGLPEGWQTLGLDKIATFLNGAALQKFPAIEGEGTLPVIKIAELRNGVTEKSGKATADLPSKYKIQDGDFLFSWSGSLLAKFWTGGPGALNQHLFKVSSDKYPVWFYSAWVHHYLSEFQGIAASKATTMGHIQRSHLASALANCPPIECLEKLSPITSPIIDKTIQNDLENRTLAQTRDLLLPKLMSGEIRVSTAEAMVAEAG